MGNESSKSTIENQQLIMQLQQQLLQNQNQQSQQPYQTHQPHQNHQQQTNRNQRNPPPIISPAELQRGVNPHLRQQENPEEQYPNTNINTNSYTSQNKSTTNKLLEILGNKELMVKIDKNPTQKRRLLEKLLGEHRHMMTTNQVTRITQMLNNLPPADNNNDSSRFTFQNIYQPNQLNQSNQPNQPNQPNDQYEFNNLSSQKEGARGNLGSFVKEGARGNLGFFVGTTPRDPTSRQLQTQQQYKTIDALTKHYKTEAEEEEARYKIEEDKRRQDFAEKQRQRRMHYQASLSDLEKSDVDALRLFQLQKNYTIDELKIAYKKMAMKTHPDKTGGNKEQFQLVTKCYMSLLEKYKNRESDKPFNDLRTGSKTYIEDQMNSRMKNKDMVSSQSQNSSPTVDKDKFDNKLFNKIYEQNKLWDSGDDGYGDWLTSNETDDAPTEVFGNKFNINVFNTTFEDYKEKLNSQTGAVQEYKEPQELVSSATGFTDIDIFARKVNDFSKPSPVGKGGKNDLAYTDLKTAYTGRGAFIDPNKVEFKTYKNVDDLKRDRSNIRYDMTPDQMRDYELKKRREIEEEEQRQSLIRQRDNVVTSTYGKIHEKMLGYRERNPGSFQTSS